MMPWISRKAQQNMEAVVQATLEMARAMRDFKAANEHLTLELQASHEAWLRMARELDEIHRFLTVKEAAGKYEKDRDRPMIIVESSNKQDC